MPELSSFGFLLVPQLYIIWRWRGIWRWLAAVPFLLIATLVVLIPVLAFFQFGIADDWIPLVKVIFYVSPLWLGLVGLTRLIIHCVTVF